MSVPPPGAKPTIKRMGLFAYVVCAVQTLDAHSIAAIVERSATAEYLRA
jgi:hypothetical protein